MKILFLLVLFSFPVFAQEQGTSLSDIQKVVNDTLASKWYERIQLRGYAQFRYNRVLESNEKYSCSVCDKSIGKNQGFFMRRARLTFFGDVSDRVFVYIQPDYAQDASNGSVTNPTQNYFNTTKIFSFIKTFFPRSGFLHPDFFQWAFLWQWEEALSLCDLPSKYKMSH